MEEGVATHGGGACCALAASQQPAVQEAACTANLFKGQGWGDLYAKVGDL